MKKFLPAALFLVAATALGQQAIDEEYTAAIRKFTTEPRFATELVDHLPASSTVPTPLKFNGYVAGAENHLTYSADVYRYLRAVAATTPRVKVFDIGRSEEGREMILVAVSDEANLVRLDEYREITRKLADPRTLSDDEARRLIAAGKPFYYATGAMHSTETGSPEMLMELVYRLAVEETPLIRGIRENVITLITPVLEVDGRDRMVDLWRYREKNPKVPTPPLVYWGHYVAHDNNRDNIGMVLNLSRNVLAAYFEHHPQVVHDLHESIPFLYVSTGTGPYNASLDPLMIDEWHRMAYHEVNELTRRGLPGVWTHGFYDGWAPNYMFWIGMGHNSIGRFYETFGNRWPTTENRVVRDSSERAWYRPNPPLPQVRWSLRNNVNYQQSALLMALGDMASNRERSLEQFWTFGKRSVAKPSNEGPAAYVLDGAQKRPGQVAELLRVLRTHGIEIHSADQGFTVTQAALSKDQKEEKLTFVRGSFIVRMDQPYSRLADTLLDVQFVRPDERVYDDTGWTLGALKNVSVRRIVDPSILKVPMHLAAETTPAALPRRLLALENSADIDLARLRFSAPVASIEVADEEFTAAGRKFPAGTVLVDGSTLPDTAARITATATALTAAPGVKTHPLRVPRVALLHTWLRTQDEGWFRLALESLGIRYDYISTQDVATTGDLRAKYDVILFAPVGGSSSQDIVEGLPPGPALPWKKTDLTPNLGGIDETEDMRPGLGLSGVQNLRRFVEDGGMLITSRDSSVWAIDYGLVRWVKVVPAVKLKAPGTILLAEVRDRSSDLTAGYDETLPVYFSSSPIFRVGYREEREQKESRPSGRGGKDDPDVPQGRPYTALPEKPKPVPGDEGFELPEDAPWNYEPYLPAAADRPRIVVSFATKADQLLISGMLEGGDELAGKPAVIDAPRGKGRVLLFAFNPMWRMNTQGTFALVTNALMNWDRPVSAGKR